ncbi:glycosyltransferase [Brevundimonas intermedia]|uniref:glycosyltransferase n=1 Tax=Brevundimonas intermedia TaxID=74315 RepID=UPI0022F29B82|nr:glycosyltransferase [Brevundimonas intermedia]
MRQFLKSLADRRLNAARRRHGAEEGDAARHRNLWSTAVGHYERYLSRRPHDIGVRVRLANTLRESGDLPAAISVLREALSLRPDKANIKLTLAEVLDEANFSHEADAIRSQMLELVGAETAIPPFSQPGVISRPGAPARSVDRVEIQIKAQTCTKEEVEMTLASLRGLTSVNWHATVLKGCDQSQGVESFGPTAPGALLMSDNLTRTAALNPVLLIDAGTVLTPDCLDWLIWALTDDVCAAYCDHDEVDTVGTKRPILQSAPHFLDLVTNPSPPAVIIFRDHGNDARGFGARGLLSWALTRGKVRHVPLVLACAKASDRSLNTERPSKPQPEVAGRILVVIPTRDEGAALEVMLTSLFRNASSRDEVDVVVIDNGSRESGTLKMLEHWRSQGVEILRRDEPFNWASLNNIACEGREHPIVVFANNDMEMLSESWDLTARRLLSMDGVGVVGARLIYPNDRVQHAGIVMGALNGEPLHEGLRAGPDERGPLDRWVRRRPATAVTGAFMAMRRSVFDQVGGFDAENFAVSCNDVDFCLRAGAVGWTILYAPELVLRHHESLSRGHSNTEAKRKRVSEEMGRLLARWGDRARFDPTRNPQWEGRGIRLFAGMRSLTAEEVMDWAIKTESRPSDQPETPTLA